MPLKGTGKIITIAQQKGGAGKTTLALQLACAFLKQGLSVATIDIDPQASLTYWVALRQKVMEESNTLHHSQIQGWRVDREAKDLSNRYDIVIIDSPPHTQSEATAAIRAADLTLIPIQPSPMDLWASRPTLITAKTEKIATLIVLNRLNARAKISESIQTSLEGLDVDISVARSTLGNRVAFATSIMKGKGVVETEPSSAASNEIDALADEIRRHKVMK